MVHYYDPEIGIFSVITPPNRAQRRAQKKRVAQNRRRQMKALGYEHLAEKSDNELAGRHPLDCGSTCLMCHHDKLLMGGSRRQQGKRDWQREAMDLIASGSVRPTQ